MFFYNVLWLGHIFMNYVENLFYINVFCLCKEENPIKKYEICDYEKIIHFMILLWKCWDERDDFNQMHALRLLKESIFAKN